MTDAPASGRDPRTGESPAPPRSGAPDEIPPDDSAEAAEDYDAVPASEHVAHGEAGTDLVEEPAEPDAPEQSAPEQDAPRDGTAPPALIDPPERDLTIEPAPVPVAVPIEVQAPAAVPSAVPPTPTAPASPSFVEPPVAPRTRHNRGFGVGIALLSTILFAALYAGVVAGLIGLNSTAAAFPAAYFRFLNSPAFWVPIIAYAVFAVLAALILNRARWAAHVFLSLVVGALVYASSVGAILLGEGVLARSGREQTVLLVTALTQPVLIAAALCARETALWSGLATAARGRRVVARNRADRDAYERERTRSEAVRDAPVGAV